MQNSECWLICDNRNESNYFKKWAQSFIPLPTTTPFAISFCTFFHQEAESVFPSRESGLALGLALVNKMVQK